MDGGGVDAVEDGGDDAKDGEKDGCEGVKGIVALLGDGGSLVKVSPDPQRQTLGPPGAAPGGFPSAPLRSRSLEAVDFVTVEQCSRQPGILPSRLTRVRYFFRSFEFVLSAFLEQLPSRPVALHALHALLAPVEPCSRSLEFVAFVSVEQSSRRPSNSSRPAALPARFAPVEPCSRSIESSDFVVASVEQCSRRPDIPLALIVPVEPCSRMIASVVFNFASVEQRYRRPHVPPAHLASVELGSRPLEPSVIVVVLVEKRSRRPAVLPILLVPVEPCSRLLEKVGSRRHGRRIFVVDGRRTAGFFHVSESHAPHFPAVLLLRSDSTVPAAGGGVPVFPAKLRPRTVGAVNLRVARVLATSASNGSNALGQLPLVMGEVSPSLDALVLIHLVCASHLTQRVMHPISPAHLVMGPNPEGPPLLLATNLRLDPEALNGIVAAVRNLYLVSVSPSDLCYELVALFGMPTVDAFPVSIPTVDALPVMLSISEALLAPESIRKILDDSALFIKCIITFLSSPDADAPPTTHDHGTCDA